MAMPSQAEDRRSFTLAGRAVSVQLKRSARRSVGLQISQHGLVVTVPNRFPLTELDGILHKKAGWILSRLDAIAERQPAPPLTSGSEIDWLGETRSLALGFKRASVEADTLCLNANSDDAIPLALEKLMRREARSFLAERLALWAGRLGLQYSGFKLSSAGTRWGSCTAYGVIRLNWRLMQAPLGVLDYVVIHELCHLVELNHSPRFWDLVASACPDWKQKREWLKHHGSRYFAW
ncbi:M48 family metallopeptidase [Chitinimonas sp. PSY-7]|uniref:YgjP-like metallopeptidase domain-containing protein n=1 Tax=Chitinimonas sp. PSY-7 TaxID=3459088 RepID=UPI004040059C